MFDLFSLRGRRASADRPVSLALGAMNFGKRTAEPEARRIIDRALERGVVLIDTANAYVDGESERIVGRALRGRRDAALITTKVGLSRLGGEMRGLIRHGGQSEGLSRARILSACDESLERLGTDYVDLYYLHVPDRETPIEESLSAIAELLRVGKIRAWGVSNYASWQILEMMAWCDRAGVARPVQAQQIYNLLVRQLDVEYFAFAERYAFHTSVYNPLAGGLLVSGRSADAPEPGSRFDGNPMYQRRYLTEPFRAAAEDYGKLATELGVTLAEFSYAFLASCRGVDSILVGPGSVEHLDHALDGVQRRLDADTLSRIDELHRQHRGTDAVYARL
jgi:aryl-alcohol dehydrogenase-like predicted oxidoreductase